MSRNVNNEKIERSYFQSAINERIKRTSKVAKACLAVTIASTAVAGATKQLPVAAAAIPSFLIACGERKRSLDAMGKSVVDYAVSIDAYNNPLVVERAIINEGELHSARFFDPRIALSYYKLIAMQQSGAGCTGLVAGSAFTSERPIFNIAAAGITGLVTVGAELFDTHELKESYSAMLDNIEGVSAIDTVQ